jgi:hypothetical protein
MAAGSRRLYVWRQRTSQRSKSIGRIEVAPDPSLMQINRRPPPIGIICLPPVCARGHRSTVSFISPPCCAVAQANFISTRHRKPHFRSCKLSPSVLSPGRLRLQNTVALPVAGFRIVAVASVGAARRGGCQHSLHARGRDGAARARTAGGPGFSLPMPAASFARLASTAAVPEREAFDAIEQRIRGNTRQVLEVSGRDANVPRAAALALAAERVRAAMQTRRWR